MSDLCRLIRCALIGLFRSRAALEAEILVLRHQLNVLRRKSPKRLAFGNIDRLVFTGLYRVAPGVLDALKILEPQTVIRWHRAGFRAYWRWKSRPRGGRPKTPADIRQLIRDIPVGPNLSLSAYPFLPWRPRRNRSRHLLNSYQKYYNEAQTHLSLHKDAPVPRAVQTVGLPQAMPVLGGLHHQYFRA